MTMTVDLDNIDTTQDDDADLSTLDRGDKVEGATDENRVQAAARQAEEDAQRLRDEQGRFRKADEKPEGDDATGKGDEGDNASGAVDVDDGDDDDDDDDDVDAGGKKTDDKNYAVRFHKERERALRLQQQLEAAQAAAAALAASVPKPEAKKEEDPVAKINAELDALYEKVEEARAEGNTKEAATLQRLIDAHNREILRIESTDIASKTSTAAQENARYDMLLDKLESEVGRINPNSDDFSEQAVSMLEFHVKAYEGMGKTPTQALRLAAKLLFDVDVTGAAKPAAREKGEPAKKAPPAKKGADINKAVDTQRRQPPDAGDRGVNSDNTKIDVSALSDEEFEKLPEKVKARYRGDEV